MKKLLLVLTVIFILSVVFCLSECSGNGSQKAAATVEAVKSLKESSPVNTLPAGPDKKVVQNIFEHIGIENITDQILEQSRWKLGYNQKYSIDITIPRIADTEPDDFDIAIPAADYIHTDPEKYELSVSDAVADGLCRYISGSSVPVEKVNIECIIEKTNDGYIAHIENSVITGIIEDIRLHLAEITEAAVGMTDIGNITLAAEIRNKIKDELSVTAGDGYKGIADYYTERLSVSDMAFSDDNMVSVALSFPDIDRLFGLSGEQLIFDYAGRFPEGIYTDFTGSEIAGEYLQRIYNIAETSEEKKHVITGSREEIIGSVSGFIKNMTDEINRKYIESVDTYTAQINKMLLISPIAPPGTGVLSGTDYGESITIFTNEGEGAHYIKFEKLKEADLSQDGQAVLTAYIGDGQNLTVYLPAGYYKLKYCSGKQWYGEKRLFGPHGSYAVADKVIDIENDYLYSLTLYSVINGNMGSKPISQNKF